MNKDKVAGKFDQTVGQIEQKVGEAIGNQKLANRGVTEQVTGAAKEVLGDVRDAAQQIHGSHKKAAVEQADDRRGQISRAIDDAKDKAKDKIEGFKRRHSA